MSETPTSETVNATPESTLDNADTINITTANAVAETPMLEAEREEMEFDVVIVGGDPLGLPPPFAYVNSPLKQVTTSLWCAWSKKARSLGLTFYRGR